MNLWGWLTGTSTTDNSAGSSPIFSYVLIGAAVLVVVAIIFGELEGMETGT